MKLHGNLSKWQAKRILVKAKEGVRGGPTIKWGRTTMAHDIKNGGIPAWKIADAEGKVVKQPLNGT